MPVPPRRLRTPARQPSRRPSQDEKMLSVVAHAGQLAAGFLAPLVVYAVKRRESRFVRQHAVQALNFGLTGFAVLLTAVLWFGLAVILQSFGAMVFAVGVLLAYQVTFLMFVGVATIRAYEGRPYRYPVWLAWPIVT